MNFDQTTQFLYQQTPAFQQKGAQAYKPGLYNTEQLDAYFGHPHRSYQTIHIGGTNGKGSCSHTLAAILQAQGYKVGLYTSPHLVDFRERIRVNGIMIDKQSVVDFVATHFEKVKSIQPSFFELTMMMAMDYFRNQEVDIAIFEVGLGGRLDSTNIISPLVSVITNISLDHVQFLGNSLAQIAQEKAGIMKPGTPVIIGEVLAETREVFERQASLVEAPLHFAQEEQQNLQCQFTSDEKWSYTTPLLAKPLVGELSGVCQRYNTATLLSILTVLRELGISISDQAIHQGFGNVVASTGLQGRWQILGRQPWVITDTGHNEAGIQLIVNQLKEYEGQKHLILGFANDKDVAHILPLLPKDATYYFTQASVERAMAVETLAKLAHEYGLKGTSHATVALAYQAAQKQAQKQDVIFVGGSNFIVADFLPLLPGDESE